MLHIHKTWSIARRIAASAAVALAASWCAPQTGRAAEPYDIHVISPLTGSGSFVGQGQSEMLRVEQDLINEKGGIRGRPLHLIFHDDQSSPQLAVQLAGGIIADGAAIILGPSLTSNCRAVAALVKNGPLVYCLTPGVHPENGSFVFASEVATDDLMTAAIRYLRLTGRKTLAMMSSTDATGQDIDRGFAAVLARPENRDMKLLVQEHFNLSDISVAAQLEVVKAANPQAIIAWTTGTAMATIFKGMVQADISVPVVIGNGNQTFAQLGQYSSFLPKEVLIPSDLFPEHDGLFKLDPAVEKIQHEMYAALKARHLKSDNMTTVTWDVLGIVAAGLNKIGPQATADELRRYIAALDHYPGINGILDFKTYPQRGLGVEHAVVVRYDPRQQSWIWRSKPGGVPLGQ